MSDTTGRGGAGGPTVYDLAAGCTLSDVEEGNRYRATVNGVVEYGVFVEIGRAHV